MKNKHLMLLFLLFTPLLCKSIFAESVQEIRQETHNDAATLANDCLKTIAHMRSSLISVLDALYDNLYYWQQAQYRPIGYFIEKGPYKWFYGEKQSTEITTNLEIINKEIQRNAISLAHIQALEKQLEENQNISSIRKTVCTLYEILWLDPITIQSDSTSYSDLLELTNCNKTLVKTYKKRAKKCWQRACMPNHFHRHWLGYSTTSLITLFGIGYYLKNKQDILQNVQESHKAAINFYQNYITTPIKNAVDIIYGRKEEKPLITEKDLEMDKETLRSELLDYYTYWYSKKYNEDEINDIVNQTVESNTLPQEIINDYKEEQKHPLRNSLFNPIGQFIRLFNLAEIKPLKIRTSEGFIKFERLYKANKLNFELLVALPASALIGLASYISFKSFKEIYHYFSPRKELLYKPIKQSLVNIEALLNAHLYEPLSSKSHGELIYWCIQLQKTLIYIPIDTRAKFQSDLDELSSSKLDVAQKLNTLQRMFRAYEFLR